jgi:hypothetical protein
MSATRDTSNPIGLYLSKWQPEVTEEGPNDEHGRRQWFAPCLRGLLTCKGADALVTRAGIHRKLKQEDCDCGCGRGVRREIPPEFAQQRRQNKMEWACYSTIELPDPTGSDPDHRRTYRLREEMARHIEVDRKTVAAYGEDGRLERATFPEGTRVYLRAPWSEWADLPKPWCDMPYYAEPAQTAETKEIDDPAKTWGWKETITYLGIGSVTLWNLVNLLKQPGDVTEGKDQTVPAVDENGNEKSKPRNCYPTKLSDALVQRIVDRRAWALPIGAMSVYDAARCLGLYVPDGEPGAEDSPCTRASAKRIIFKLLKAGAITRFALEDGKTSKILVECEDGLRYARPGTLVDRASVLNYKANHEKELREIPALGSNELTYQGAAEKLNLTVGMIYRFVRDGVLKVKTQHKWLTKAGVISTRKVLSKKAVEARATKRSGGSAGGRPEVKAMACLKRFLYWQRVIAIIAGETWADVTKAARTIPMFNAYQLWDEKIARGYAKTYATKRKNLDGKPEPLPWPPEKILDV